MAVVTYTQNAVLGAYQQWLMQQGAQACLERRVIGQDAPDCAIQQGMVRAQAGSLLRYSVLTTLASANVFFAGQFLSDVGMWQNVGETVTGTSAGGIDQVVRPATAGCYKNMVASVGTAVVAGSEVYVLVELGRTNNGQFTPYAILLSGYVRTNEPIDSGGGPKINNPPTTGGGGGGCCIESMVADIFSGTTTATYSATVAAGTAQNVKFVANVLTTSANAANRLVLLSLLPTTGRGYESRAIAVQTASTSRGYVWQAGGARYQNVADGNEYLDIPDNLWFDQNYQVELSMTNVQAGDSWTFGDVTIAVRAP